MHSSDHPNGIRKVVGKPTVSPIQRVAELLEFLKKHKLWKPYQSHERIRKIVGPAGRK